MLICTERAARLLARFNRDVQVREQGQDIVEYAFLAGLISIVAVGIIVLLGPYLQNAFQDIINAVNSA
jgi:Flp pilus assembly pilin Flp